MSEHLNAEEVPRQQVLLQGWLIGVLMAHGGSVELSTEWMHSDVVGTPDGRLHAVVMKRLENSRVRLSVVSANSFPKP